MEGDRIEGKMRKERSKREIKKAGERREWGERTEVKEDKRKYIRRQRKEGRKWKKEK